MLRRKLLAALIAGALLSLATQASAQTCSGCSCKGGPGFRLPTGQCASWKQNETFCDGACYPAGTADERHQPAPKPPIKKPAAAPD